MKRERTLLGLGIVLTLALMSTAMAQEGQEERLNVSQLPAAVAQALKTNCPKCVIAKATREVENGVLIYDFEFKKGRGEMDMTQDGFVVSRETVVRIADIPAAARDAIRNGAATGRVAQVLKEEVRADLADGKVIKLETPKHFYEADLVKGNEVAEIVVTPEGQVIEAPVWTKRSMKEK